MSDLLQKLMKSGSVKESFTLSESPYMKDRDMIPSDIPALNIMFSGDIDGGLVAGLTVLAGPSRHFKSHIGLMAVKAYFNKYPDAVCLFYDSEFGITSEYLESHNIDSTRVLHIPIEHIEQLKFDISKRLEDVKRGDKVCIFVDSVGNLASKKEVEDALDEKSVADMTRAKQMKGLFRIITPHLTIKDLPCIVVAHTYQTMEMFSKSVISGGTGIMYSANQAFIIGKAQEKDGAELVGYNFTINAEKSRFVKEKSKIPLTVKFDGGVDKYSGILQLALDAGMVAKPSMGWYQLVDTETGEMIGGKVRAKDTGTDEFLGVILKDEKFKQYVRDRYRMKSGVEYATGDDAAEDVVDDE